MQVFFEKREQLVGSIWHYFFRPEQPVDFEPGQYVELFLDQVADDGRGRSRTLTITSIPGEPLISFAVDIPDPHSAYKERLITMQPGDSGHIGDAMGDLILPKNSSVPLIFIAGGLGMASFVSMLSWLTSRREERPVYFFYAMHDRRQQLFRELTDAYPLALKTLVIAPNRLTAKQVRDSTPPDSLIYISGSQKFVEDLRYNFEKLGIPRSQIVFDYFDGYAEL